MIACTVHVLGQNFARHIDMSTRRGSAALVVILILTPVALAVGTGDLLPVALMLLSFVPLFAVLGLLALERPGAGNISDSQAATMDQRSYEWFGSDDLSERAVRKPVVLEEPFVEEQPALPALLNRELANGKLSLHDLMP